jgi:hypothetical protein
MSDITKERNISLTKESLISLDFIYSNSLNEIEYGIKKIINGVILSKKAICIALARIKTNALFKQAKINTFKEYLKKMRIPIKYSTALDYAIIGEMLVRYKESLYEFEFKEEDGLKKLLLLEEGLRNHKSNPRIVFEKIKEATFSDFKRFVKNNKGNRKSQLKQELPSNSLIRADGERIYLVPSNI